MFKYYIGIGALSIFVIVLVFYSIVDSGGPFRAKDIKNDQTRISNFEIISREIEYYVEENGALPANLQALDVDTLGIKITDPATGKEYAYTIKGKDSYDLCTEFSADKQNTSSYTDDYDDYGYGSGKIYKKGYYCVNYKVSPTTFNYYEDDMDDLKDLEDDFDADSTTTTSRSAGLEDEDL